MPQMKPSTFVTVLLLAVALRPLVSEGQVNNNNTLKDQLVVHTPLQNYEQPTLRDYEECQLNHKNCVEICNGDEKCESECPLCPELSDEPLLVQGINDTSYVPPPQPALNTTNIIKLTNEIRNIIKNDIQARNEVNVQVQQNVSQVGGRFGLGYSEQGSCCYVVRRARECEHKEHCEESSRQRVCGERCQARVMLARRVVQCDEQQPEQCHETVEYVPARRRKNKSRQQQSSRCRYLGNSWPYISCAGQNDQGGARVRRQSCQSCLDLTYGYILQNGLPPHCSACFQGGFAAPLMAMPMWGMMPMPSFNAPQFQPDYRQEEEQGKDEDSGWVLKTQKCLGANGKLEDCPEGSGDGSDLKPLPPAHLEDQNKIDNGNDNDDNNIYDYDNGYDVPAQRRRRRQSRRQNRQKFVRSLYSRRKDN